MRAIAFASAFYGALAYGRSVRDAFELAVGDPATNPSKRLLPELFEERLDAGPCLGRRPPAGAAILALGACRCASLALAWWVPCARDTTTPRAME